MITLNEIKSKTECTYFINKKNKLETKDSDGTVVSDVTKCKGHKAVAKQLGMTVTDLKDKIMELLSEQFSSNVGYEVVSTYSSDYIERQWSEKFVITEPSSQQGWKIGNYPSGHSKVGSIKQSVIIKEQQALAKLPVADRSKAACPFEKLHALEAYEPFINDVLFEVKEDFFVNIYRPSIYLEIARGYYVDRNTGKPTHKEYELPKVESFAELPDVIQAFFIHFFPKKEDRVWFMHWLAWSVFEQCEVIPMLLGNEGTGKGMLGGLWSEMLGKNNWSNMNAASLEGQFAMAVFSEKRGVSINEGTLEKSEQWENLKNSTDQYIRVNQKHEKVRTIKKTHSTMYTANNLSGVKGIDIKDSRRLAILEITNTKLKNAEVTLPNDTEFKFTEENIRLLIPEYNRVNDVHNETLHLFSFLHYLYENKLLDTSVKNTARKSEFQTMTIAEASAPNYITEIVENVIPKSLKSISNNSDNVVIVSDVKGKPETHPIRIKVSHIKSRYDSSNEKKAAPSAGVKKIGEQLKSLGEATGKYKVVKGCVTEDLSVGLSWGYLLEHFKSLGKDTIKSLFNLASNKDPSNPSYEFYNIVVMKYPELEGSQTSSEVSSSNEKSNLFCPF